MANFSAVVIAGGQGTRFWPLSRTARPKQFMRPEASAPSLIQATSQRFQDSANCDGVFVVTNVLHAKIAREHLPKATIITEPCPRNTAAAIGLAAIHVERRHPKSVMLVLPSDHAITGLDGYRATIGRAVELAAAGAKLVTIGIPPTEPHSGYGYIQRGDALGSAGFTVKQFIEKPDRARAEKLIASGGHFWNSGQFAFRTDILLAALEEHMPELSRALRMLQSVLGTPKELDVLTEVFSTLASVSIDYGVLEKARNVALIEASGFTWNDIGSWDAWALEFPQDDNENVLEGDALVHHSRRCFVVGGDRLIALVGMEDVVVVDTPDATLVCRRDRAQEVRDVVAELRKRGRDKLL